MATQRNVIAIVDDHTRARDRVLNLLCICIAALGFLAGSSWMPASAQHRSNDNAYYYVANTRPPDAFLALRTHPTSRLGLRIAAMPNGTFLQVLQRQPDGWWYVRMLPSGQEGWALSGQGNRQWIECCVTASTDRVQDQPQTQLVGFKTPSKNVHCQVDEGVLRCEISEMYGAVPPRPRGCEFDWGQAFAISEDARWGQRMCHSDTVVDDDLLTLSYGSIWQRGAYTCKSEQSGLICINALGHGFSLSRNSQKVF
jgi:hypothetical protein